MLGLVRARRGDPGHEELLEEAWALGEPTGELERMGAPQRSRAPRPPGWQATARASVAATEDPLGLAIERRTCGALGELALWRRRAGIDEDIPHGAGEPYASQLAGEWKRAVAFWDEAGCPYEAALARADSGDE